LSYSDFSEESMKQHSVEALRRLPPIYFYHVNKTGGRSLFHSMLALASGLPVTRSREDVPGTMRRVVRRGFTLLRWTAIPREPFFFCSAHTPMHEVRVPNRCFTLTILRDPFTRLLSRYRDLVWRIHTQKNRHIYNVGWAKDGFHTFVRRLPKCRVLRQTYMFSKQYSVQQALDAICGLNHVFFMEEYAVGLRRLGGKLGVTLEECNIFGGHHDAVPSYAELLEDEASCAVLKHRARRDIDLIQKVRDALEAPVLPAHL
jgi:hypothetical protein